MRNEQTDTDAETLRVAAPVIEHDIPVCSEVLLALPDPADPDQAILGSVPFLVDGLNFGDIVRLGDEDEHGVRPVLEVVVASGHVHLLAAAEDGEGYELVAELQRMFPDYGLRITQANDHLLSVSVHPDFDPGEVAGVISAWLGAEPDSEEIMAMGAPCETELGLVDWTLAA
jgi:hypothetical protein